MTGSNTTEMHDERWHDEVAAYALDGLTTEEAEAFEAHLSGCESCRERLRWLTPAVDQIPTEVEQLAAPATLRASIMDIVDAEADVPRPAPESTAAPGRWRRFLPSFQGTALRPALAGFAAMLLLAAGLAGYALHDPDGGPGSETYTAELAPGMGGSGTLEVNGDKGSLTVSGMPRTRPGDVYQAWIKDESGTIRPSSVFVVSDDGTGSVSIPDGLEGAAEVMVTREPKGGSKLPTETPFMTAQIT